MQVRWCIGCHAPSRDRLVGIRTRKLRPFYLFLITTLTRFRHLQTAADCEFVAPIVEILRRRHSWWEAWRVSARSGAKTADWAMFAISFTRIWVTPAAVTYLLQCERARGWLDPDGDGEKNPERDWCGLAVVDGGLSARSLRADHVNNVPVSVLGERKKWRWERGQHPDEIAASAVHGFRIGTNRFAPSSVLVGTSHKEKKRSNSIVWIMLVSVTGWRKKWGDWNSGTGWRKKSRYYFAVLTYRGVNWIRNVWVSNYRRYWWEFLMSSGSQCRRGD